MTNVFNSKITEVEKKIPNAKDLASKIELKAIQDKIPGVSNLVKKTDYATEIMLLILEVKVILVMMVCKIILCFSRCTSILKE